MVRRRRFARHLSHLYCLRTHAGADRDGGGAKRQAGLFERRPQLRVVEPPTAAARHFSGGGAANSRRHENHAGAGVEYRIDVERLWFRGYIGTRPLPATLTAAGEGITEFQQREAGILSYCIERNLLAACLKERPRSPCLPHGSKRSRNFFHGWRKWRVPARRLLPIRARERRGSMARRRSARTPAVRARANA
jgi:hypothetical protein